MDGAKKFLAHAVPWPGPQDDWWINIHHTFRLQNGRTAMPGRAFRNFGQAIAHIEWLLEHGGATDIYVCMSGQSQAIEQVNKWGKTVHRAVRSSTNAVWLRSLWLDVDVKDKGFASTLAAQQAWFAFRTQLGLPKPTFMVLSGSGGFHAHFVLEDPVDFQTWAQLSNGLASATKALGFVPLDTGVTIDAARLLRVPDTWNHKTDPPKPVTLAYAGDICSTARIAAALAPYVGRSPARHVILPAQYHGQSRFPELAKLPVRPQPQPFDPSEFKDIEPPPPTIEAVADACPFIEQTLATAGRGVNEPVWRESLKVAYYCQEGADVAQRLSSGHVSYSRDDTSAKFERIEQDHGTGQYGWPQCGTIYNAGAVQCATCPKLALGKSPLNHVNYLQAAPASPPASPPPPPPPTPPFTGGGNPPQPPLANARALPPGYRHDADLCVVHDEPDPDDPAAAPVAVRVTPVPMWNIWPQDDKDGERFAFSFHALINRKLTREVFLPYIAMSDPRTMSNSLSKQGILLGDPDLKRMKKLMTSFTEMLHAKKLDAIQAENFGWSDDAAGKPAAFVYGRTRWNCAGNTPVALPHQSLSKTYQPVGTLSEWQAAAKLVFDQQRPELDAILAAAFGAPLVALTGHNGLVLSIYSPETAASKSTVLRVSQATWGHPVEGMAGLDDTPNYVIERLGQLRHLPFYYDEIKMEEHTAKFVGTVFALGQGKGKGRLTRNADIKPVISFATMMIAASNNSMVDYISEHTKTTTAGLYRVFEFRAEKNTVGTGIIDSTLAQVISGKLNSNYGHAGLIYAEFLGQNAAQVALDVENCGKLIGDHVHATQDERFWVATITVLLLGAKYATKLGLLKIDTDRLLKFLLRELERHRADRNVSTTDITKASNVEAYVSDYINARRQQTVITDTVWHQPSRPPVNYKCVVLSSTSNIVGRLCVHVAKNDLLLRISLPDFKAFLKDKHAVSRKLVLDQIKAKLPVRIVQSPLGSHTVFRTAVENLIEFDLSRMPGFFEFD